MSESQAVVGKWENHENFIGATKHPVKPTTNQRVTDVHGFGNDSVRVLMEDVMTAKLPLSSQKHVALWLSVSPRHCESSV